MVVALAVRVVFPRQTTEAIDILIELRLHHSQAALDRQRKQSLRLSAITSATLAAAAASAALTSDQLTTSRGWGQFRGSRWGQNGLSFPSSSCRLIRPT